MFRFTLFNHQAALQALTQQIGKIYSETEMFDLNSLSSDFINTLGTGIRVYENYHLQHRFARAA